MFVKIFKNMPVICTKDQNSRYNALTTSRVSSKKRAENDSAETLRTFSINSPDTSSNSTFLAGAAIPNSTVKAALLKNKPVLDISSDSTKSDRSVDKENKDDKYNPGDKKIKGIHNSVLEKIEEKDEKSATENCQTGTYKPSKSPSLIAASEKIKELQELQKQLHKSYEPKPLFEPRRPTMDSIKSAIEKAKQEAERNKSVGTKVEEVQQISTAVLTLDASTSTEKIHKKKSKKKKKEAEKSAPSTSASTSSPPQSVKIKEKKKKKINIAVKLKANVDRSSQP